MSSAVLHPPHVSAAPRPEAACPLPLTALVGRERETGEVRALLASTRLLTLTGAGGSGKTRLALEVAAQLASEGGRPVAWVELAPLESPEILAQHVASTLGLPPEGDAAHTLQRSLREHPLLLVLDNCEHLVDACAALAEALMRVSPGLTILATSREALGVPGERAWLVPPLTLPDARSRDAEAIARAPAVQLFAGRAADVATEFRVTDENAPWVAEVCRRLDGLPLAIELAASWVRVLSPSQIADRLGDAFRLPAGRRTAIPRQQTLRATMDWSYGLLSAAEQRLLARFSVFTGTFSMEAAEAVCPGEGVEASDVLDRLSTLVDKSLVVMQERGGAARYRLLEIVRQYGAERLREAGEESRLQERHARYFLALAEELGPRAALTSGHEPLDRLEQEHDNLRAALRWTLARGDADTAARLARPMWGYWSARGSLSEGEHWLRQVHAAGPAADPLVRAHLLFMLGTAAGIRAAWDEAEPYHRETLALYRSLGDAVGIARTLSRLSSVASARGDYAAAEAYVAESWAVVEGVGDPGRMSEILNTRGRLAEARGDLAAAAGFYEEGIRLAREGDNPGLSSLISNRGIVAYDSGDLAEARARFVESLTWARSHQRGRNIVYPISSLACVLVRQGAAARAAPLFGATEALFAAFGAHLHPRDRPRYETALAAARASVDAPEWDRAWKVGQGMTLEDAVEYALAAAEATGTVPAPVRAAEATETVPAPVPAPDAPAAPPPGPAVPALEVRSLGGFRVIRDGVPMTADEWAHSRPRELLLYLLAHPDGRTREQIGLAFWPESSSAQVKNSFHVTLHRLRRIVDRSDLVVLEGERYRVNPALPVFFDASVFEKEVVAALRAGAVDSVALARLERALELYRGHFLDGEAMGDWHLEVHDRVRRLYADGLSLLADRLRHQGEHARAAGVLERLVRAEELDEDAHRRLIDSLARSGRRDRALLQYERLVDLLRRELESEPEDETTALIAGIRGAA